MIRTEDIDAVAAAVGAAGPSDAVMRTLRRRFPDYHFTICCDDDIVAARPVREARGFNLYLVGGGNGCIGFTTDAASASGLVIAELAEAFDASGVTP